MAEMPEFIRKAIEAQGKVDPDEVLEKVDEAEDDVLLGVVEPAEEEFPEFQEVIELGSIEPADHA